MQTGKQPYPYTDPENINRSPEFDPMFKAPIGIDVAHHEIHEGDTFTYCDVVALGNGGIQDYVITTPNTTKWAHLGYKIDFNDGAGTFELFEGANRVGTTLQECFNRERNSLKTNTTIVHKGQTGGTTDGTRFCYRRAGSNKDLSGTVGSGSERVLKQNTKYIVRITNATTLTNNVSVEFDWYEHQSS